MLNSPKAMIVRFWPALGFPVIQDLPPKMKFTAKFFADNILPEIVGDKPACDHYRRLVLHIDNTASHPAVLTA
jgi:hypothetical protein